MNIEVFYKINLDDLKCELDKQNNIEKYNKEKEKLQCKYMVFRIDKNNNITEIINNIKFIDCIDTYYNSDYKLYFDKKDLKVINNKLLIDYLNDINIIKYNEFINKIIKLVYNDKNETVLKLFMKNNSF